MPKILGIDEVGRGPLAGPLVVGAVILPENAEEFDWYEKLRDSKKITAKKRKELAEKIRENAAVGLGWVEAREIDKMGISAALKLATRRAVEEVQRLHVPFSQVIIDGDINFLAGTKLEKYTSTVVKGDNLVKEISAASIVAKVARDEYMIETVAAEYPDYGFERHVGYGTELHRAKIRELGVRPEHRRIVKMVYEIAKENGEDLSEVWTGEQKKNTTKIGKKAEEVVVNYFKSLGHLIVAQNYKNKYCEIDIISVDFETIKIFFTEVKYRKDKSRGGGLAAVDKKKQDQMYFAAKMFLAKNAKFRDYSPLLTAVEVTGEDFEIEEWVPLTF